jgi:hypothetical protein
MRRYAYITEAEAEANVIDTGTDGLSGTQMMPSGYTSLQFAWTVTVTTGSRNRSMITATALRPRANFAPRFIPVAFHRQPALLYTFVRTH